VRKSIREFLVIFAFSRAHDIDIDYPWAVAARARSRLPTKLSLDCFHEREKIEGRKLGFDKKPGIEKRRLILDSPRRGLVDGARPKNPDVASGSDSAAAKLRASATQHSPPIAKIGTKNENVPHRAHPFVNPSGPPSAKAPVKSGSRRDLG
jgi:hypothetical protein